MIPKLAFGQQGPTRYKPFVERCHEISVCTGSVQSKARELVVDAKDCPWIFDLEAHGMYIGQKGYWHIFLKLDLDTSLYEDLRLERAQNELAREQAMAATEEVIRQTQRAIIQRRAESRNRLRASLGMRPRSPTDSSYSDFDLVRTIYSLLVFSSPDFFFFLIILYQISLLI